MKVDYMKRSKVHRLTIKDNTHKNGLPTFTNMERQLTKIMNHA